MSILNIHAFPKKPLSFYYCTCAGQVQFSFAKPQLGSMNSAGVELDSEHHFPLRCMTPPVVTLDLQRRMQENDHFTWNVSNCWHFSRQAASVTRCKLNFHLLCYVALLLISYVLLPWQLITIQDKCSACVSCYVAKGFECLQPLRDIQDNTRK